MVTFHPTTGCIDTSFGRPFSLRPRGAKFPVLFEFFQNDKDEISIVLEHDEVIITSHDREYLMSAFQLVLALMIQHKNIEEILSTVLSKINHPDVTDGPVELYRVSRPCSPKANPQYLEAICEAFATCLDINTDDVYPDSSFFDLGASLVDAVRLAWLLSEKGICITVRQVLLERTPVRLVWAIGS